MHEKPNRPWKDRKHTEEFERGNLERKISPLQSNYTLVVYSVCFCAQAGERPAHRLRAEEEKEKSLKI